MRSRQINYELGFKLISNSQRLNPANYFRTLNLIKKRENQYKTEKINIIKKDPQELYKDYFVMNNIKKFKIRLSNIKHKPAMPILNEEFIRLEEKLRINKTKQRELYDRALSLENDKLSKRFFNKKPGEFNPKILEKINSETHDKYIKIVRSPFIMRKQWLKIPLILPKVFTPKKGKINYHSKTEFNIETENNDLFNNTAELKGHDQKETAHQKRGHIEGQHGVQQLETTS